VWNKQDADDDNTWNADDSLKSFLFMLKKHQATRCDSDCCPRFGYHMRVFDHRNASTRNLTLLGSAYPIDTGLYVDTFFACSRHFRVKEIKVFEITD
jgi:hypothetical protein